MNSNRLSHQHTDQHEAHSVGGLSLYSRRHITTPTSSLRFIHPQFCERSPLTFQERSQPSGGEAPGRPHLSVTFTIFNCLVCVRRDQPISLKLLQQTGWNVCRGLFISQTVWRLLRASTHRTDALQWSQAFILKSILTWILIHWSERNTSEWSITYFKNAFR